MRKTGESVKQLMTDNPAMADEIEAKIREKIKENKGESVPVGAAE